MKKVILLVLMSIGLIVGGPLRPAYAEEATTNKNLLAGNINLQGDTVYLPKSGQFGLGIGTTIANIDKDGIIDVRGETVSTISSNPHTLIGIGIGVNIPKLITKFGGTWGLKQFTVDIFVAGLLDMSGKVVLEPVIGVSILKMNF